jgi:hypothetical protein
MLRFFAALPVLRKSFRTEGGRLALEPDPLFLEIGSCLSLTMKMARSRMNSNLIN